QARQGNVVSQTQTLKKVTVAKPLSKGLTTGAKVALGAVVLALGTGAMLMRAKEQLPMVVSTNQDVQTALNELGFHGANGLPLTVDGILGTNSTFAVKAFQTAHALSVDGIPGPITKAALTAALANAGNPTAAAVVAYDNAVAAPSGVQAVHVPPTPTAPAMTLHTTPSGGTTVKPYGTPASAISQLAQATGAKPTAAAPLKLKVANMSTNAKIGVGVGLAALAAVGIAMKGKR